MWPARSERASSTSNGCVHHPSTQQFLRSSRSQSSQGSTRGVTPRLAVAILALVSGTSLPVVTSYRGTVPIFPDVAAARKKAAETAAKVESAQRPKIFAPPAVIKTKGLTKIFDKHHIFVEDEHVRALDDITAVLHGPGSVALVGETGGGKTTFLKCLAGLEEPTSGEITVNALRKAVFVGASSYTIEGKTVRRRVRNMVAAHLPTKDRQSIQLTTNTILGALDLHGCSRTTDRDLSGGEVYRFKLAMALAEGCSSPTPPVLLLDGFFDKSDSRVRYGVEFTLFDLQKTLGVMLLFTAHNHQIVMELGKQVADFSEGKIVEVSLPEKSRYARHVFERLLSDIRRKAEDRERGPVNYMAFP